MRLVVDAQEGEYSSASSTTTNPDDGSSASMQKSLAAVQIDPADASLSPEEKTAKARDMLLGTEYRQMKDLVVEDVEACANELLQELENQEKTGDESVQNLLLGLSAIIVLLVVMQTSTQYVNYVLVMRPMRIHARNIQDNEPLDLIGSRELQYVARSYNTIYEENHRRTMLLRREAETDVLTGLLNRGSYDKLLSHHGEDIALVIIDVDYFKQVNDTYGHGMGDRALKKVATAIKHSFRASDYVCRIGGDEFAVIMTEMQPIMRPVVESKLDQITEILQNTDDGLPVLTLSTGIAFSSELPPGSDIYQAADKALYTSKHHGRNQYSFYGDGE
jgi:diguanylate cyclase (GGDEF)-like protein